MENNRFSDANDTIQLAKWSFGNNLLISLITLRNDKNQADKYFNHHFLYQKLLNKLKHASRMFIFKNPPKETTIYFQENLADFLSIDSIYKDKKH